MSEQGKGAHTYEEAVAIQVEIQDDFDLDKIASCGQCFRVRKDGSGRFRFITGDKVIDIRALGEGQYAISCDSRDWQEVWWDYFDLGRNYAGLRKRAGKRQKDCFIARAMECGCGLRVLRQDPWEMLATFIISQRKNIPAISRAVELLAQRYGHPIAADAEKADAVEPIQSFPTPEELAHTSEADLRDCGLGYRAAYVRDAVDRVLSGELDLNAISAYEDEKLFQELMKVHGVGKKVADCVCLFGYSRSSRAPVDVWIDRAIQEECGGKNPFPDYGEDAGIIQQYIFYYQKHRSVFT